MFALNVFALNVFFGEPVFTQTERGFHVWFSKIWSAVAAALASGAESNLNRVKDVRAAHCSDQGHILAYLSPGDHAILRVEVAILADKSRTVI